MPRVPESSRQVGDVAVLPLLGPGYGAAQVIAVQPTLVMAALDWYSMEPPTLDQIVGRPVLTLTHHAHDGRAAITGISGIHVEPAGLAWLGSLPLAAGTDWFPESYASWHWLTGQVEAQRRWDLLNEDAKTRYRAMPSGPVAVDLGAGSGWPRPLINFLDLGVNVEVPVPASGPVNWQALGGLTRLTRLTWAGPDRGLTDYLRSRPLISNLHWIQPPPDVDLTGTGLVHLGIEISGLRQLNLPDGLRNLSLRGVGDPRVELIDSGRHLDLTAEAARVPGGLGRVRHVSLEVAGSVSVAGLRVLEDLESLWIIWRKPPGELLDADAIAGLQRLDVLTLSDAYGVDADLPVPPALRFLQMFGVRRSVATAMRARFKKSPVQLIVQGSKSDDWLAANAENPLRDWVDDDQKFGEAACRAYATAVKRIRKSPDQSKAALADFVTGLNKIDGQHGGAIDTLRREQAGDAFAQLANLAGMSTEAADEWFDELRDF